MNYQLLSNILEVLTIGFVFIPWGGLYLLMAVLSLYRKIGGEEASIGFDEKTYSAARDSRTYQEAIPFLHTVRLKAGIWHGSHVFFCMGIAAIMLASLLFWAQLPGKDPMALPALLGNLVGGIIGLLAAALDMCLTPLLARTVIDEEPDEQHRIKAWQSWQFIEWWRELLMKPLAQALFGMWMIWLSFGVQDLPLSISSLVSGAALFAIGVFQAAKLDLIGPRGVVGKFLMSIPVTVWCFYAARWFWLH
jgi:hypothetical protein